MRRTNLRIATGARRAVPCRPLRGLP
jgi:hypothetical protein